MKYPAYPKYKDSGVAWLGEMPSAWKALPLRRLIKFVKTGCTPSGAEEHHFENRGFSWYTPSDFSESVYLGPSARALSEEGKNEVRIFPPMTVMVVGIGATIGKVGLAELEGSCNQQINGIVCDNDLDPVFATYYLKTMRDFIVKCGKYTTMPIINQDETKNLIFIVPPVTEQTVIAEFLDRETGRIDTLVAKKRKLVELLKEKRSALISRTVTRGLPADAAREFGLVPYDRFTQSGVDWLGEIPECWKLKAIKWESAVQRGASPRPIDDPVYFDDEGEYAWVRISDVTASGMYLEKTEQKLSEVGASLSVKLTPGKLFLSIAGSVGKPCITKIKCCIHDGFVYFPRWKGEQRFLYYIFASGEPYKGLGKMGTQLNLNTDTVGGIVIGLPKPNEQTSIADFLDRETARIDKLTEKVETAIARLQEYRSALITAAVTGKIDVREYV